MKIESLEDIAKIMEFMEKFGMSTFEYGEFKFSKTFHIAPPDPKKPNDDDGLNRLY